MLAEVYMAVSSLCCQISLLAASLTAKRPTPKATGKHVRIVMGERCLLTLSCTKRPDDALVLITAETVQTS